MSMSMRRRRLDGSLLVSAGMFIKIPGLLYYCLWVSPLAQVLLTVARVIPVYDPDGEPNRTGSSCVSYVWTNGHDHAVPAPISIKRV
jgi:hypothetical protein